MLNSKNYQLKIKKVSESSKNVLMSLKKSPVVKCHHQLKSQPEKKSSPKLKKFYKDMVIKNSFSLKPQLNQLTNQKKSIKPSSLKLLKNSTNILKIYSKLKVNYKTLKPPLNNNSKTKKPIQNQPSLTTETTSHHAKNNQKSLMKKSEPPKNSSPEEKPIKLNSKKNSKLKTTLTIYTSMITTT